MHTGMRRLARLTVIANVVFVLAWLLAATWQGPHYSSAAHTISDMYADGAPGARVLILVFTLCGATVMLFAARSLWPALRAAGRPAAVGAILLALSIFGLGDLLSLFEREGCRLADAGCTTAAQTATFGGVTDAVLSTVGVAALAVGGFLLATAMLCNGIEATRRLAGPGVPEPAKVLVVTTFDLDEYVYDALRAGASGFLLKDARPAELIAAVRTIAAGESLLAPAVTRQLIGRFADRVRPSAVGSGSGPFDVLARREIEVLTLIATGMSNAEIAASLVISPETVKTHVSRILTKLGLRDRVQAVALAYRCGLAEPGTS